MQRSDHPKRLQSLRLVRPLVFAFAFFLRSQGVLAELDNPPGLSNRLRQADQPSIAIIGAGIGGSFTAYNLRQLLNNSAELHM